MTIQEVIAILLTVAAIASYINHRFLKLPSTIGLTLITLMVSLVFIALSKLGLGVGLHKYTETLLLNIDFNTTFMGGMISFLLFAGGLHINAIELAKQKWIVAVLATVGVVIATLIVGFSIWLVAQAFGIPLNLMYCLVFGALISPTDPIAVLGILKSIKTTRSLEMKIAGESLFNDGSGIVMFVLLLGIATGEHTLSKQNIVLLLIQQLGGGLVIGALYGLFANWLLEKVDEFEVSVLITLSLVTAGYILAVKLGVSGPITMVVAGLIVGAGLQHGNHKAITVSQLRNFWDLVDEVLNAVLFVLIGLVVFQLKFTYSATLLAITAIPITLLARFISVAAPVGLFSIFYKNISHYAIRIMTWGGVRGGVCIALALSLPPGPEKEDILVITYAVVVFSIIVQGLTIGPLIRHSVSPETKQ